jgi:hypothetical protein
VGFWHPKLRPIYLTVTTGSDGTATISFPASKAKPIVVATAESDNTVVDVISWVTDTAGNYIGAKLIARALTPTLTKSTGTFVTGISVDRRDFTKGTAITGVSTTTGTFVTGITVDKRDFTTASAVTGISTSTGTFVTSVGDDNPYYQDASGYLRHSHAVSTRSAITGVTPSTGTFVTGITSTAGNTVVANVTASTGSAVTGVSTTTGTFVTGITSTAGTTVVANVSSTTGSALTDVTASNSALANKIIHVVVYLP